MELNQEYNVNFKSKIDRVDIIVPFHGQFHHLHNLLTSLWNNSINYKNKIAVTQNIVYNLFLVDDGSGDSHFLEEIKKKKFPGVTCIRHQERQGFSSALYTGFKAGKNAFVVFLNSDVVLSDIHWLDELCKSYMLLKDKGVKMISSRIDVVPNGSPKSKGDRFNPCDDIVLLPESISSLVDNEDYLPIVAVLTHRKLFEKIGFFKPYPLGCYEDLEFACRMAKHNFKQAVCGKSAVEHVGGCTINAVVAADRKLERIIEKNYDQCLSDIKKLIS